MQASKWLVCAPVCQLLEELDDELLRALQGPNIGAVEVASHLVAKGGKRLRPALLLLAAQFGAADRKSLMKAAAAMELLHVASLYHDDVMDRSLTRRGAASANSLWGNLLATSGGTLLFAKATEIIASLGNGPNKLASAAAVRLCTGQLQEVENAYNVDISEDDHLRILEEKTATLFELPCQLGALLAEAPEETSKRLVDYARALGLAFQLADDVLDLSGEGGILGKPTLNDIREGVYSFPVIYALRNCDSSGVLSSTLRRARLNEVEVRDIIALVRSGGAVEASRRKAKSFVIQAQRHVEMLTDNAARESLHRLADFALSRSH